MQAVDHDREGRPRVGSLDPFTGLVGVVVEGDGDDRQVTTELVVQALPT
jgi:hypothetical protein